MGRWGREGAWHLTAVLMSNQSFAISQREIEFISSKKGRPVPAEAAFPDNWPIAFSEYIQRTVHHAAP